MKYRIALILLLCFICAAATGCDNQDVPIAVDGELHAQEWNPEREGMMKLEGEWEFYWKQLIDPQSPPSEQGMIVEQPALWNGLEIDGETLSSFGYASYRLRVHIDDDWPELIGVRVMEISTSFRLYINGQLVSSAGDPGTSRETTRPRLDPQTNVYHRNGAEDLEIVLHIANFIDREGGRRRNIFLGTGEEANIRQYRTIAFEGILTGSLLLIGLYHLILYSFRRKEPLPLIFALVCFVFALRGVFQGERLILMLIEMPFSVYGKIWFIFYYILPPVVVLFLHYLFPQDVWPRMLHFILGIMTVFCVLTVFLSLSAGIRIMPYYHPVTLVSMLYAVWVLLRALRHSRPGSWPFTIGVFVLISTGIHDLLYTEGIIQTTYLAPAGLLAFVFSQSYFIAVLFSKSLARVKALSEQLRAYSIQLEDKVALRTRELENRNAAILESIEYARLIQSSVLPE
ncbi:MAG: 7TM-DISM domain-containing protein, partial [Spirochaeta sp.]